MNTLSPANILALGFMTFALFLGAGNVIFPPSAGLDAGTNMWPTAIGFLLTAVGLPLLTLVSLARVGGGISQLTAPLGRWPALALAVVVYLCIGPLFATPRTAVVSYEVGLLGIVEPSWHALLIYTVAFFSMVLYLSLRSGSLMDSVGKIITPVLLVALIVLGGAAVLFPAGPQHAPIGNYQSTPFIEGILQGYLTMDTLGALVFGIVITTAIREHQVHDRMEVTRYTIIAAVIAATGLALVYLTLFQLGATSQSLVEEGGNGGAILSAFVLYRFGTAGSLLLGVVITLACLTTAVGLMTSCGAFFSRVFPVSYRQVVWACSLFSLLVANQGLESLINFSVPVLIGLYPLAIILVCLGLWLPGRARPENIMRPVMLVALVFGVIDGLKAANLLERDLEWMRILPLASQGLGWLFPAIVTLLLAVMIDRVCYGSAVRQ